MYLSKEFQICWSTGIKSGPELFPANGMALDTSGCFAIEDDVDIQMLNTLLSAGYCVRTVANTDGRR